MLTCENGSPWCTESEWQDPDLYPMLCRKCLIALIADRDRLRAENERLTKLLADTQAGHEETWSNEERLRKENERLGAELEKIATNDVCGYIAVDMARKALERKL